ncbi:hypothetical protein CMK19_00185 [Candidatus Poribacteria bacterium]|nr:hypothetical protein [Candidatus Poribacteria bacterium]
MAITINGSGTISGISSGGINDDVVDAGTIAANSRMVLEQFYSPCDGSVIALEDGNHTLSGPSANYAVTNTFTDIAGSSFTYTPPTGTTQVIYDFMFAERNDGGSGPIISYKLLLDSDEVTKGRTVSRESSSYEGKVQIKWGFNIGGTADTTVGRVASWTSDKTIKIQCARYSSTFPALLHETSHWGAGGSDDSFVLPTLGITAIG